MAALSQRTLSLRKTIFVFLLAAIGISIAVAVYQGREWKVPEEAKRMKNPIAPSVAALENGRRTYLDKCAECHGETGKGDGPKGAMYSTPPASLTDRKRMVGVTDGEIFYQITEGRRPMPSFKKRLTEEERWELVLFVRTFSAPSAAGSESSGAPASTLNH